VPSSGIKLEVEDEEIPWGSTADELRLIGNPECALDGIQSQILWRGRKVLGGLAADVLAKLHGKQRLRKLDLGTWRSGESVSEHHTRIANHFNQYFGAQPNVSVDPFASLPSFTWYGEGLKVHLMVFDRFGEYCIVSVLRWSRGKVDA
jgi:hypothetical protein